MMSPNEPQDDLMEEGVITWVTTNEADKVKEFSAVCLLTAKYMADVLGKEKVIIIFRLISDSRGSLEKFSGEVLWRGSLERFSPDFQVILQTYLSDFWSFFLINTGYETFLSLFFKTFKIHF